MTEAKNLDASERAVMCVLMLRGPQTAGELRGRTGRLAEFASVTDVETTLNGLVARELVVQLPRRPGQKEERYAHLLSGPVAAEERDTRSLATVEVDASDGRVAILEAAVDELRRELADLRTRFDEFTRQFG